MDKIFSDIKVEVKSGLSLIDEVVNKLAQARFILQSVLEKSRELQVAVATNEKAQNKPKAPIPKETSKKKAKNVRRYSSSSSEGPPLMLPSKRGYKLKPIKKSAVAGVVVEECGYKKGQRPGNYLKGLKKKYLELLDTEKIPYLYLEHVKCVNENGEAEAHSKPSSTTALLTKKSESCVNKGVKDKVEQKSLENGSKVGVVEGKQTKKTSSVTLVEKKDLFEDLLKKFEDTFEDGNKNDPTDTATGATVDPIPMETDVIDVKTAKIVETKKRPGPASRTNKPIHVPPPVYVHNSILEPQSPIASQKDQPQPPPPKKSRPGPASKTKQLNPENPDLSTIKQKLLLSFRDFRKKTTGSSNLIESLKSLGNQDAELTFFGLEINCKLARFFGSLSDSDSDSGSESDSGNIHLENPELNLSESNFGQFFVWNEHLLHYKSKTDNTHSFKKMNLEDLSPEQLNELNL